MLNIKNAKKLIRKHFNLHCVLIILILILGAYLRIYKISEYLTFLGDEGRDVLVVKRMIVDHKFTLLGPTASVGGFFMGPIYYYFMMPFLWAWNLDPTGPAVMVGLFGVLTIYLVYLVGKYFFSPVSGLAGALLYALSPLVIATSRSSWNPNIVPFFAVLLFYILGKVLIEKKTIYFLIAGVILGIGIQLHYLFSFLYIVSVIWITLVFVKVKKLSFYKLVNFLLGIFIGVSLFFAFEVRHGFPNSRSIFNFIFGSRDTGIASNTFINNLLLVPYRMVGRLVFRLPDEATLSNLSTNIRNIWHFFVSAQAVFFGVFIVFYALRFIYINIRSKKSERQKLLQDKEQIGLTLLSIWTIVVLFLFGFYQRQIYDHYLGIIYFIPFVFIGYLFWKSVQVPIFKYFALFVLIALSYFNWQGRPFLFEPNRQLAQVKSIAKFTYEKTANKPFNFALIAPTNTNHAYRYFFEIWGNPPVTIENKAIDPERDTVTDQLLVICEKLDCEPLGHSLWEIAGFGRAEIVGEWSMPFVKIFKLVHYN